MPSILFKMDSLIVIFVTFFIHHLFNLKKYFKLIILYQFLD